MDYAKHYEKLINRATNRTLEGYSEQHHIIPRCMGGTDCPDNLVSLTPEEHYIAHLLLCKMHPGNIRLVRAAIFMSSSSRNHMRHTNKVHGFLRRQVSDSMKGDNNPMRRFPEKNPFAKRGREHPAFGKPCNEELKQQNSKRMKIQNPLKGVNPWKHPAATAQSLEVWSRAAECYEWWIETQKSYGAMATHFGYEKATMAHNNMIQYFRNGWIPNNDDDWVNTNFKEEIKMKEIKFKLNDHVVMIDETCLPANFVTDRLDRVLTEHQQFLKQNHYQPETSGRIADITVDNVGKVWYAVRWTCWNEQKHMVDTVLTTVREEMLKKFGDL